jgi:Fur family ferric uptake transcriptional regulator
MDAEARDRWLAHAERRLRGAGLRAGPARNAIVELLAREAQCLVSAAEIAAKLRNGPAGSPATIYRTLEALTELGLLHRVDGRDGIARYEVADPERHHHHFLDERTGEVIAFEDDELEAVIEAVAERLGVDLDSHDVILRGSVRGGRDGA